ncbi:hypothetical protein ACL02S_06355 [Nocardia sp. 004]|uniref:hypothetical protein n=1 Tax=Nocardia sp. 004 TaxID=3385978 RepID=UPI0039A1670C
MSNPLPYTYGGGLLFFTDGVFPTSLLYSVPQTGGTPTPLVTGLTNPIDITVSGGTLFITLGTGQVVSAPITGTATTTVITSDPTGVFGITA